MGFFRKQEEQMVIRLLVWRYKKANLQLPDASRLSEMAQPWWTKLTGSPESGVKRSGAS